MIFAMSRGLVLSTLVLVIVAICFALLHFDVVATPRELFEWTSKIALFLSCTLVVLSFRPVLRVVHLVIFAKYWWFPWLDGEWSAEIRSNWPKVRRTYLAAKGEIPQFDALAAPLDEADELVTMATVTIEARLFNVTIEITPDGTKKTSRTRFVRPRWAKPDRPELSYVYEQLDNAALPPTDTRHHFGAGIVEFIANTGELSGHYWTNRRADAALNTAGTIVMRRVVQPGFFARLLRTHSGKAGARA